MSDNGIDSGNISKPAPPANLLEAVRYLRQPLPWFQVGMAIRAGTQGGSQCHSQDASIRQTDSGPTASVRTRR